MWHTLSIAALEERLAATASGLTASEAARRLAERGRNELTARRRAARVLGN
ncbi:MAG: hypothetical protein IT521_01360 [Burkholderiales bacterium]|nr:hypothetical protein [Burkholderiales bacterium]